MKKNVFFILWVAVLLVACSPVKIPQDAVSIDRLPSVYPGYTGTTIPYNIAPLDFRIKMVGDKFVTVAWSQRDCGMSLVAEGRDVCWDVEQWHRLLMDCKGDTLCMEVYALYEGKWVRFEPMKCYVAPEAIDSYLSYRLIEPSFTSYEDITLNQRNLTNFEDRVIFNNSRPVEDSLGRCINCHSFQDYNRTGRMQFHIREYKGGTVIADGKNVKKVNLKTDGLVSSGVYPSWHPSLNLIAYSVNTTRQYFHSKSTQKVEVMDLASGLVLYDANRNEVTLICDEPDELETFPSWSPDGSYLYYVSAHCPEELVRDGWPSHYQKIRYDIYRRAFDAEKRTFSAPDTVFRASVIQKSATFPRVSPDGRYLLFTMGDYGTFHIWHKSSDLYVMDLHTGKIASLERANSDDVDSYHSWSSNGSWIVFSSRRDDGSYTRPYICYFKDGKESVPFILPQKYPAYYQSLFKSFNVPEFMVKPVEVPRKAWAEAADAPAVQAVLCP